MTSHKLFCFIVFTSLLFLFISSPCSSTIKQDEKVNLSLYYETLCPGCASFISHDLGKVFEMGLISVVNLRLVPWGNADIIQPNQTIVCQHGEDECYFNTIDACAIKAWPEPKKHFDFIRCLENETLKELTVPDKEKAWQTCCQNLTLSEKAIKQCYDTGRGRELELQYANETSHLKPPHDFVPWVTVNGNPLRYDFENFIKYVCNAYKGQHVPEACKSLAKLPTKASKNAISSTSAIQLKQEIQT